MEKGLSYKFRWFSLVMTLMIVCYHVAPHILNIFLGHHSNSIMFDGCVTNFYQTFGEYALSYFFATSAYLFFKGKGTYGEKIKKRINTLLLPYMVWNFIYILFFMVFDKSYIWDVRRIILGFTIYPFDGPLWYIPCLVFFFLVSRFFLKQIEKINTKIFYSLLIVLILIAALFHRLVLNNTLSIIFCDYVERLVRFIPAFLFGAFNSRTSKPLIDNHIICLICFLITLFLSILLGDSACTVVLLYFSMFFLFYTIPYDKVSEYKDSLYINTFVIYAMHDAIVRILLSMIYRLYSYGYTLDLNVAVAYISPIIATCVVAVACVPFSVLINKENHLRYLLTGGR